MEREKPWYLSRTIWASLVAVVAIVSPAVGVTLDAPMQGQIVDVALATIGVAASLFAIVGRLVATTKIV